MAVRQNQIGPAIIVIVKEHDTPAQKLGIASNSRSVGHVRKRAIPVIVIKSRRVIGKVGLEDVQLSVPVVIRNRCAHASLLTSILVVGYATHDGCIGEGSISIISVENVGCAVAGDIDVGPAVIVVIQCGDAEAVMS